MIKKYIKILSWIALVYAFSVNADIMLKDESEILGKWKVYAESGKLDGEKKYVDNEWDFAEDGILHTTSTDPRTGVMKITVKYSVEDGTIKKELSSAPGRGKYESCKVVEKDDTKMTIKCTFEYFFLTKK